VLAVALVAFVPSKNDDGNKGDGKSAAATPGSAATPISPSTVAQAPPTASGVGTPEALANPSCDPATKRIKIPIKVAPPCVKPWTAGTDNGGSTSDGVTADTITVVMVGGSVLDTSQDRKVAEQAWRDVAAIYQHAYTTWGRNVKFVWKDFGVGQQQPTEAAQRAMAIDIANLHPFGVLALGGGTVLTEELAARKIIVITGNASMKDAQQLAPYVWSGSDAGATETLVATSADYIKARLLGKPAQWAGDASMKTKTRSFGLLYPETAEPKYFDPYFAKDGIKLTDEIPFAQTGTMQERAPTLVAKLKNDGVTTVIVGTDVISNIALSKQATDQQYFPEWLVIGHQGTDISGAATYFDQKQWAHAFGFGQIAPAPTSARWQYQLLDWYWGKDKPTWRNTAGVYNPSTTVFSLMGLLFTGVHLAGPPLTPTTFRDAMFSDPPSGGTACDCVTTTRMGFGRDLALPGFDNYFWPTDFHELWYDAAGKGMNENGQDVTGLYRFIDGGKRVGFGQWSVGDTKAFDPAGTVIGADLVTPSAKDAVPDYSCADCPSKKA
jgi:hypothetical protein